MLRPLKIILSVGLLAFGLQSAHAFSLGGPIGNAGDAWQTAVIGYGLGGDINAPKNIGEEYRWTKPVLYYSYDAQFLTYFGSNGVAAADEAFAIMNNLTNVSQYSADLSEFPLSSKEINYTAQALGLLDLKSTILDYLIEQVGLASPERYVWTIRQRITGNPCPTAFSYLIAQRNFDPITFEPSSYVNGILYTYAVVENCTGPNPLAFTTITTVDPLSDSLTSVATFDFAAGGYTTGLTRDDLGGLRYLYRKNNVNSESAGVGTTVSTLVTNTLGGGQLLTTLDLGPFLSLLPTTDPATLLGLYPN
jgi:hypothetical protein